MGKNSKEVREGVCQILEGPVQAEETVSAKLLRLRCNGESSGWSKASRSE